MRKRKQEKENFEESFLSTFVIYDVCMYLFLYNVAEHNIASRGLLPARWILSNSGLCHRYYIFLSSVTFLNVCDQTNPLRQCVKNMISSNFFFYTCFVSYHVIDLKDKRVFFLQQHSIFYNVGENLRDFLWPLLFSRILMIIFSHGRKKFQILPQSIDFVILIAGCPSIVRRT